MVVKRLSSRVRECATASRAIRHTDEVEVGPTRGVPGDLSCSVVMLSKELLVDLGRDGQRQVGDSHLHLNIMPADSDELKRGKELALGFARKAVELGGTVSAEHGIGRLKHDFLRAQYGDEGLAQMAEVKRAFDPPGILNRDVMFPAELLEGGWGEA